MQHPDKLMFDHLQSDNYEPESYPGAGDGKGWRLSKNGDCQLGDFSMVNGEIFSRHGNVRVDSRQYELGFDPDKNRYLREAGITPAGEHLQGHVLEPVVFLTQEQIEAAKCDLPPHIVHKPGAGRGMATQCDLEVIVRVDLPEGADPANAEGYAHKIRQIVMDTINSSEVLQGMRSGRVTTEATVRAETDSALASRIGALDVADGTAWGGIGAGLDLGKEYLAIEQPGGDVTLGRLSGKPLKVSDFAVGHLAVAPMTANGKVPINNLPRPVDDDK